MGPLDRHGTELIRSNRPLCNSHWSFQVAVSFASIAHERLLCKATALGQLAQRICACRSRLLSKRDKHGLCMNLRAARASVGLAIKDCSRLYTVSAGGRHSF